MYANDARRGFKKRWQFESSDIAVNAQFEVLTDGHKMITLTSSVSIEAGCRLVLSTRLTLLSAYYTA